MVDREARDMMAGALRHFVAGRITWPEFRERSPRESKDESIGAAGFEALSVMTRQFPAVDEVDDGFDREAGEVVELRLSGERALSSQQRRDVCRTVLFLQSDQDYKWGSAKLTWWAALLLAPLLVVGLLLGAAVFCACIAMGVAGLFVGAGLTFSLVFVGNKIGDVITRRDYGVWPFFRREDYDKALKHPKLLCGKRV